MFLAYYNLRCLLFRIANIVGYSTRSFAVGLYSLALDLTSSMYFYQQH